MATKREDALVALRAALAGISSVTGLEVFRNPHFEMDRDAMPALCLWDGGQRLVEETNELKLYELTPIVEGYVTVAAGANVETAGDAAGTALNALYGAVVLALYADRTLGGAVMDLFEGDLDWDAVEDEGAQVHLEFTLQLRIVIQTAVNDPSAAAP